MTRTILNEFDTHKYFWVEVVNISCYVLNRVILKPKLKRIFYEFWRGRKPNILYFKVFCSKYFILNTKDYLDKLIQNLMLVCFLVIPSLTRLI
jgi:hypothetical protein